MEKDVCPQTEYHKWKEPLLWGYGAHLGRKGRWGTCVDRTPAGVFIPIILFYLRNNPARCACQPYFLGLRVLRNSSIGGSWVIRVGFTPQPLFQGSICHAGRKMDLGCRGSQMAQCAHLVSLEQVELRIPGESRNVPKAKSLKPDLPVLIPTLFPFTNYIFWRKVKVRICLPGIIWGEFHSSFRFPWFLILWGERSLSGQYYFLRWHETDC